ncbi:Chromate transport protein ChrA [Minicystis rosea]|nr:Chromate transport protein ChrA [Minicystis rosea]
MHTARAALHRWRRVSSEPDTPRPDELPPRSVALRELAALFLRLGTTAFGGPAVHIAMMEDEVVRRRKWMTHEAFLDLYGATNLIPGPNSTEMAIHIGHRRAGFAGLVVAGASFILPAALITGAMAWAYVRFGALPQATAVMYGIKPVIIAVVIQALAAFARTALKKRAMIAIAVAAVIATFSGVNELVILLGAGAITAALRNLDRPASPAPPSTRAALPLLAGTALAGGAAAPFGLAPLFLFFLKVGAVLFGSGYVLLAFLRADLVERFHWLTETQLLDAVAIGQFTPGPLFTTATFIGYVLGGAAGAAVATVGIFLPAFVFVAVSGPLVPKLRRSPLAGAFLDGVNAASLALMAAVTWQLGRSSIVDVPTALLAVVGAAVLLRYRPSSVWLVLGGGLAGIVIRGLR